MNSPHTHMHACMHTHTHTCDIHADITKILKSTNYAYIFTFQTHPLAHLYTFLAATLLGKTFTTD